MGLIDRDYMRDNHPPTCTYCECDEEREKNILDVDNEAIINTALTNSNNKIKSTSILNILLHFVAVSGFAFFSVGSNNIIFSGLMGFLALLILIDAIACIKGRLRGR